jgi:long-chain acyl-CoA synthetase
MLAMPDGTKVYPEDIEAVLARDARLRDATVVGWQPPHGELRVHAVLLLDDPSVADAVVRDANAQLGAHQQIRGVTIWPDEDLPRTHTLKVKKRIVLDRLAELEGGGATAHGPTAAASSPVGASSLEGLVASVADVPVSSVQPGSRLSTDLNMDSLARIELLGVIEEELGTFVDDGDLEPDTTVAELSALVDAAKEEKHETGIFGWPLSPIARAAGILIQVLILVPAFFSLYRVRVTGLERLQGLKGPALFTPNHCLHNDVGIILTRIPLAWRWHLSVAAAADDIFGNPIRGFGSALIGNAFPLAREGAVRRSLELLGARLDRGFSILIFPEGKLTVGGPTQPFKSGTGLVAVLGATPVVPMKLKVSRMSRLDARRDPAFAGQRLPWRGEVELVFGDPIRFAWDTDHLAATQQLEAAVAAL